VTSSSPEQTFNLLEALAIAPVDEDTTPTQSTRNTQEYDMAEFSDNVDQLIKETDEAFQAVGLALADAKATTYEWHDNTATAPFIRTVAKPRNGPGKKRSIPNLSSKTSIWRSSSVVKAKRQPFHLRKTKQPSRTGPRHVPPPITPERWTLTDVTSNLVDVFSGKIFRTEVDEMLTPGRMQLLQDNGTETRGKRSSESNASLNSSSSTPTEPFNLESLSASIDAATQVSQSPFPDPILPPPPVPKRSEARRAKATTEKNVGDGTEMTFEDLNFPSPPRKSSRAGPLGQQMLPTIPEISSITLAPPKTYGKEKLKHNSIPESIQDSITLFSTPFTLTSPLFRHGPIRIGRRKANLPEEALDWTAFQMAILGTMDSDTSDGLGREPDETELDSITEWFAEFGFEGPGALIGETPNRPRIEVHIKDDNNKRKPWRGAFSGEKMLVEGDLKESRVKGVRLEDGESLPSSPMLDLSPPEVSGSGETIIPMGYNLGHDLGDFLSWEAQHIQNLYDA
jgi:hypothetical protein